MTIIVQEQREKEIESSTKLENVQATTTETNNDLNRAPSRRRRNIALACNMRETVLLSSCGDVIVCRCNTSSYPPLLMNKINLSSNRRRRSHSKNDQGDIVYQIGQSSANKNSRNDTNRLVGWNPYVWESAADKSRSSTSSNGLGNAPLEPLKNTIIAPSNSSQANCCDPKSPNFLSLDDISCHAQKQSSTGFCNPWGVVVPVPTASDKTTGKNVVDRSIEQQSKIVENRSCTSGVGSASVTSTSIVGLLGGNDAETRSSCRANESPLPINPTPSGSDEINLVTHDEMSVKSAISNSSLRIQSTALPHATDYINLSSNKDSPSSTNHTHSEKYLSINVHDHHDEKKQEDVFNVDTHADANVKSVDNQEIVSTQTATLSANESTDQQHLNQQPTSEHIATESNTEKTDIEAVSKPIIMTPISPTYSDVDGAILPIPSFDHTHFYEDDSSIFYTSSPITSTSKQRRKTPIQSSISLSSTIRKPTSAKKTSYQEPQETVADSSTRASLAPFDVQSPSSHRKDTAYPGSKKVKKQVTHGTSTPLMPFPDETYKSSKVSSTTSGTLTCPPIVHGVPTFSTPFSSVKIVRVSAHPLGSHVLCISDAGLLLAYGLNDYGQLGIGFKSNALDRYFGYVMTPTIVVSLVENGGKAIACAAGVSHSLVVVQTEERRITKNQHNLLLKSDSTAITPNTTTSFPKTHPDSTKSDSTTSSSSSSSPDTVEYHHQVYGFGRNDYFKIGLVSPKMSTRKSLPTTKATSKPSTQSLPLPTSSAVSLSSISSATKPKTKPVTKVTSVPDPTNDITDEMEITVLPRRVGLRCKVHPRSSPSENENLSQAGQYGIFALEASITHSAALVRRSSKQIELYSWGNATEHALGHDSTDGSTDSSFTVKEDIGPSTMRVRIVPLPSFVSSLSTATTNSISDPGQFDKSSYPALSSNLLDTLNGEYPASISLGPSCTYVVTSAGRCFVFGTSDCGMLGLGCSIVEQSVPKEICLSAIHEVNDGSNNRAMDIYSGDTVSTKLQGHFSTVSAGASHVVATTISGKIYAWGKQECFSGNIVSPASCVQGRSVIMDNLNAPRDIDPCRVSVMESGNHQYENKQCDGMIAWYPTELQLDSLWKTAAICTKENQIPCNKVETLESLSSCVGAIEACAGYDSSFFVSESGKVYSCGIPSGRLGQGYFVPHDDNNKKKKTLQSNCTTTLPPQTLFGDLRLYSNEF